MAEIGSAFLTIAASARGFGRDLESQVSGETRGVGKKVGGVFGSALKGGAVAAIGGAFVAASFLKDSLGEAREAQKIGAATTAIIKATGGAANLTAAQVGDLSGALSNKIGVDDEIIQSGANILLTFKSVRDELGKGNDVFTRATAAGADLAAAGFGSIESNAKTLGKALNDPLKGITALTRSGVTFTDQQKEQIKTLVASGDTLKAQKIILSEVEKQVGGVAAASATSGEKATVAFGNLKEQIGTALLPIVDKLATTFTDKIVPAVSGFVSEMQSGTGAGGTFVQLVKNIFNALKPVGAFILGTIVPAIAGFIGGMVNGTGAGGGFVSFLTGIYNAFKPIGEFIAGTVVPAIKAFVAGMVTGTGQGGAFVTFLTTIKNFIVTSLVPAITGLVSSIKSFIQGLIPIIETIVAALLPLAPKVAAIFGQIGQIVVGAINLIKGVIDVALPIIAFLWETFGTRIVSFVKGAFTAITTIISGVLSVIQGIIKVFTSVVTGNWSGLWEGLKQIVSGVFTVIKGLISGALNAIKTLIGSAVTAYKTAFSAGFDAIKEVVRRAIDGVKSAFGGLADLIGKARDIFGNVLDAIRNKLTDAVNFVEKIPGKIKSAFGDPLDMLKQIGKDIVQGLINGISGAATAVGNAVAALVDKIPGPIRKIMGIASPSKVTTELGQFIGDGLAKGITDRQEKVAKAVTETMKKALDALESKRDAIKSVIDGLRNDFASLSSGIASTFTGNLFEATNRQDFITNLMGKRGELAGLKKAFGTLRGFGLDPAFLSQLFQSGNGALILELAAGGRDDARGIATLFEDTQSLGNSLGNQVAKADIGPDIRKQTKVLESIRDDIRVLDKRIGDRLNAAATAGKKGRVAA